MENLQGRVELLERRLQLLAEELSLARSHGSQETSTPASPPGGEPPDLRGGEDSGAFPAQVHIDADSISAFAHGFYPREYDVNGVMFRWTGNGPLCELRFFIDRSADRKFRLNVGDATEDIVSQVRGYVDYAPIQLTMEEIDNVTFIEGAIPKRADTRLAVASFLLGELGPKKKKPGSGEAPVWLGFKFYAFDVS